MVLIPSNTENFLWVSWCNIYCISQLLYWVLCGDNKWLIIFKYKMYYVLISCVFLYMCQFSFLYTFVFYVLKRVCAIYVYFILPFWSCRRCDKFHKNKEVFTTIWKCSIINLWSNGSVDWKFCQLENLHSHDITLQKKCAKYFFLMDKFSWWLYYL